MYPALLVISDDHIYTKRTKERLKLSSTEADERSSSSQCNNDSCDWILMFGDKQESFAVHLNLTVYTTALH